MHPTTAALDLSAVYAGVVTGSPDAIFTQDLTGTILTWNAAAEGLYGYPAAEVLGRSSSLLVPDQLQGLTRELLDRVAAGIPVATMDTERLARNGQRIDVSVSVSPVRDPEGDVVAAACIARDVTEQRWMAATLNSTLEALQLALGEAQQSEEISRRFLSDAAHQLRTPVAGIRACAEALLGGPSAEDHDRLLATMVRETSRAGRLVGSLLRIARLDQGQALILAPVDVLSLCAEEVDRTDLLAPQLDVRLEVRNSPTRPLQVDGTALHEIISNLLDNARRHAAAQITVILATTVNGEVQITVANDGPAVPVAEREQIFQRFVSLDGRGGSGLGLPIARGLAEAMGGTLRYDGEFVLTLPLTSTTAGGSTETTPR